MKALNQFQEGGKSYDCFICSKVTELDENNEPMDGKQTEDCEWAEKLHERLKKEGLNPFFSEVDIKRSANALATKYEAIIFYALRNAKCMIIVCSEQRYFDNSKYMQNEYNRFRIWNEGHHEKICLARKESTINLPYRQGRFQDVIISNEKSFEILIEYVKGKVGRSVSEGKSGADEINPELGSQSVNVHRYSEGLQFDYVECVNGSYYKVSGIGICQECKIRIPPEYNGLPVKSIGGSAFKDCKNIKSVSIPNGVTNIGDRAFFDCKKLKSIDIPDSLISIGKFAFCGCKRLKGIDVPNGIKSVDGSTFKGCKSLIRVSKPDSVIIDGVDVQVNQKRLKNKKKRRIFAFLVCLAIIAAIFTLAMRCLLDIHTAVTDKAKAATCSETGLTEGKHCFVCGEVLIQQKTTEKLEHTVTIDQAKAATCTSTGLTEGKHCSVCGVILVEQKKIPTDANAHTVVIDEAQAATCFEAGLTEGKHCSECGKILTAQTPIPILVHEYQNGICVNCREPQTKGLEYRYIYNDGDSYYKVSGIGTCRETEIHIPSEYQGLPVKGINYQAFKDCTNILSITIPNNVTTIEWSAFSGCSSLTNITIPNSVTSIGSSAFSGCSNLMSIMIPDRVTSN